MKNKKNYITSIAIVVVGFLIWLGVFIYASFAGASESPNFVSDKKNSAQKIYTKLKAIDLIGDYPKTPEVVMDVYCDTVLMLYGNMIADEDIYFEILNIQRQLYTQELLEKNPLDLQYENFMKSKEDLLKDELITTDIEHESAFYSSKDEESCILQVRQYINKAETVYWNYYLNKSEGKWKISTWELTDENFKAL